MCWLRSTRFSLTSHGGIVDVIQQKQSERIQAFGRFAPHLHCKRFQRSDKMLSEYTGSGTAAHTFGERGNTALTAATLRRFWRKDTLEEDRKNCGGGKGRGGGGGGGDNGNRAVTRAVVTPRGLSRQNLLQEVQHPGSGLLRLPCLRRERPQRRPVPQQPTVQWRSRGVC